MKILLIVNTSASSVTARAQVVIQKALSGDHELSVAETSRRGHAARLTQGAVNDGAEVVVVLGGDGTLNEVANGLAGTGCALAILPGGSTNVFARTIGLPNDPIEATGELLGALANGSTRRVGLGSVNGRYFLFHVGVGFDAAVVQQVERRAELKRHALYPLFVHATFATWFRHYDRSRPRFSVNHADGAVVDDAYFAVVCNTDPYTFFGEMRLSIAPDAGLDAPLATVTLRTLRFFSMLGFAASALRGGRWLRRHRLVDYHPACHALEIRGYGPVPYQVDGDYMGEADSLRFRWEPDALSLVLAG